MGPHQSCVASKSGKINFCESMLPQIAKLYPHVLAYYQATGLIVQGTDADKSA
jgi:hypothetical protein